MGDINLLKNKVLSGDSLTDDEAYSLLEYAGSDELYKAAGEITRRMCSHSFDPCSIANVKSGRCSENCKWCAQSAHHSTGCEVYEMIDHDSCMASARDCARGGIKHFSLVASGKRVEGRSLTDICSLLREIKSETGMATCASLGLLTEEAMKQLAEAGITRYHCNLETAPSFFPQLCSTHTIDDKIATINHARSAGLDICSGGIIGMGETARQRVELALTLRKVAPVSIPINILCPIAGTPLENMKPLEEQDILTTVAIFRFIHPRVQLRFAGGRNKLSREGQLKAMRIGVNGAIVGDLLTTIGSQVEDDRRLAAEAGYTDF